LPSRLRLAAVLLAALAAPATLAATPAAPGATPLLQAISERAAVEALVGRMQAAVAARDAAAYLALADLSDPVFRLEHTRWAEGWARETVQRDARLALSGLRLEGEQASATLEASWTDGSGSRPTARLPVVFRRTGGGWLFAGERWVSVERDGVVVRVAPGLEGAAPQLLEALPAVKAGVAGTLGFDAPGRIEVKAYADSASLGFMTLLSLPAVSGWNEPGEAIKMVVRPGAVPSNSTLAHELAHSFLFQQYPGDHLPWWVHEGVAQLAASRHWSDSYARDYLRRTVDRARAGELVPWERIADFTTTPVSLWTHVYPQGYAFFRFLEEAYGPAKRAAWTAAAGRGEGLDTASRVATGLSFPELDAAFRGWLAALP